MAEGYTGSHYGLDWAAETIGLQSADVERGDIAVPAVFAGKTWYIDEFGNTIHLAPKVTGGSISEPSPDSQHEQGQNN